MSKKNRSPQHEPAVYQDDPDAIATVSVYDAERNTIVPVEVGYYYHGKGGSTIYLLNDPYVKQLLWEASEVQLTRFTRTRPTARKPQRNAAPTASYRPVLGPDR